MNFGYYMVFLVLAKNYITLQIRPSLLLFNSTWFSSNSSLLPISNFLSTNYPIRSFLVLLMILLLDNDSNANVTISVSRVQANVMEICKTFKIPFFTFHLFIIWTARERKRAFISYKKSQQVTVILSPQIPQTLVSDNCRIGFITTEIDVDVLYSDGDWGGL